MFMTREQLRRPGCQHPDQKPNLDAVLAITRAWAEAQSGFLRTAGDRISLLHGEPASPKQLQSTVDALYAADGIEFIPTSLQGRPLPPRLANELWIAAGRLASRGDLKGRARHRIVPGPNYARLNAFPIRALTARFAGRAQRSKIRLGDTVRMEKSSRMEVLDDLVALEVLGVLALQAPKQRSVEPSTKAPLRAAREPEPRVQVNVGTEQRLSREWDVLRDADDWTVLGCGPGMDAVAVERAARRMASRYRQLSTDRRVSEAGQTTAKNILMRVLEASAAIRSGTAKRSPGKTLSVNDAFGEGLRQIEAGAYDNAVKCFAVAQKEHPLAAKNTAWLGFALYHDYTRDLTRQRKAMKLIEKALEMGNSNGDAGYVMARILHGEGELVRAWNYLDKVIAKHPQHAEATALRASIQRDIRRD